MFSHFLRKLKLVGPAFAEGIRTLRVGERRWQLAPQAMAVFGPNGPDLDRWIANGSAEIVKTGSHRTVYRVSLPGGTIYVKHCRMNGVRSWCREALRPPKARLEFEDLRELRRRGIPAVEPLAWGRRDSRWPGESFLITRGQDRAVPFLEWSALHAADSAARRIAARELGRFFARLHDAGIAHPDPHPGNLLVESTRDGGIRFALLDLHAVGIGRPLTAATSRANLAVFNRWFQLRASRTDRLRFWQAYRQARTTLPSGDSHEEARELERRTAASNRRFWIGRRTRCLGTNRYFERIRGGHSVRGLPRELIDDPDGFFAQPGVRILKDSRTSTVAELPGGLILKRVNVRHWFEPLKNWLRPSAVLRSWIHGHALADRWLPTPRPLAAWHRHRFGLPAEGYLLTEKVEAPAPLAPHPEAAFRLARLLRALHDRGVSHRDLKAANILLARGQFPTFIDLVGVRLGSHVTFRQRAKELARLNASFLADSRVSITVRLRFLHAYLAFGERRLSPEWKAWWRAISQATAAKEAKNRRRGRPLA